MPKIDIQEEIEKYRARIPDLEEKLNYSISNTTYFEFDGENWEEEIDEGNESAVRKTLAAIILNSFLKKNDIDAINEYTSSYNGKPEEVVYKGRFRGISSGKKELFLKDKIEELRTGGGGTDTDEDREWLLIQEEINKVDDRVVLKNRRAELSSRINQLKDDELTKGRKKILLHQIFNKKKLN
jgi:hypothetical protein